MNKNYEYIFLQCADSWDKVSPSVTSLMFERAENMNYKLGAFKNWLLQQPISEYTKSRVEVSTMIFVKRHK